MTAIALSIPGWPSPTRRGVRHTSRLSESSARAAIYGLTLPEAATHGIATDWSPVGTGGSATPSHLQAIVSLVSNALEVTIETRIPLRDQITFTRHYLSLSVADYARLVGVERPAVYAWMDGTNEPRPTNHANLNRLYRAAQRVKEAFGEPAGALLRATTPEVERPLYDLLSEDADAQTVDTAISVLSLLPRKVASPRALPNRSEGSLARGRMRALSTAGRRLK